MSNLQDHMLELKVNVLFCFIYLKLHCDIAMWLLGGENKIKHIMAERTYNGFTNRETWLVNVFYRESILEDGINLIEGNLEYVKEDITGLKDFNTTNLTIVTPETDTLFTYQYEPKYAWGAGCQFVCMYYQKIDQFIQQNADKFKRNSFILKPANLRSASYSSPNVLKIQQEQNTEGSTFGKCSLSK